MSSIYSKHPLSIKEQVKELEEEGIVFNNDNKKLAEHILCHNYYYRFSRYTKPFKEGVDFETVLKLYEFDCELRSLLMHTISKIEIALRTQIINHYSMTYSSHWHINPTLFKNQKYHADFLKELQKSINDKNKDDEFIGNYKRRYTDPSIPPNWMCFEIISFGQLSLLYKNLDDSKGPKIEIAKHFGLKTTRLLGKWIHGIHIMRNICAHHGRLWNRPIPIKMLIQKEVEEGIRDPFVKIIPSNPYKIYASLCSIQYFLDIIEPNNTFRNELKELMNKLPANRRGDMGFVKNWDKDSFWNKNNQYNIC